MASHHDPYFHDSRTRPSRPHRHDSYERPRQAAYPRPDPDPRRHDQPPARPSQLQLPIRDHHDSSAHTRSRSRPSHKRWPPPPTQEDEVLSLRREAASADLIKLALREVIPARGSIDQEPLIEAAPGYINEHEKRFVLMSERKRGLPEGIPTPPTSDDDRRRKARRRPSKLETDFCSKVPELDKRTASPYSFKPAQPRNDLTSSLDRLVPSNVPTPPPQDQTKRQPRMPVPVNPPSPRRDSERPSSTKQNKDHLLNSKRSNEDSAIDESTFDSRHAVSDRTRHDSFRHSGRRDPSSFRSQTSAIDFAPPQTKARPVTQANVEARRNSDAGDKRPTVLQSTIDKSRRPSPLTSAFATSDLTGPSSHRHSPVTPSSREGPHHRRHEGSRVSLRSSRTGSPARNSTHREQSPPQQSSYGSARFGENGKLSSPSSKASSADGSRPVSPALKTPESPRMPKTDADWNALLVDNVARKAKPPSRLSSSMRQESMPEVPRSAYDAPGLPSKHSSGYDRPHSSTLGYLPYPEDDGMVSTPITYMPSEREYQYFAPTVPGLSAPLSTNTKTSREPSPGYVTTAKPRPFLRQHHSDMHVTLADERQTMSGTQQPTLSKPQIRKPLVGLTQKSPSKCRRRRPVAGKLEWYTIIGAPDSAICPSCLDLFEGTIYRSEIRQAPPRDLSEKVKCSIGASKWMQLAWRITAHLQWTDLALLKDLVSIDQSSDPCPGDGEGLRSWYGLRDSEGSFVRGFTVCYSDVRKLERLLPTLSGMLVRMPQRYSHDPRRCAMGITEGDRFAAYLEEFIITHDKAVSTRKAANAGPLTELVKRRTRFAECLRDRMLRNEFWHYMPELPALTVCEECFEHIVEPEILKGADVAKRFQRTVQPIHDEGPGCTCQLYSSYMRQTFATAIRRNNFRYLADRAHERREAEVSLNARWQDVKWKEQRLSQEGRLGQDGEYRLQLEREAEQIGYEWREQWE